MDRNSIFRRFRSNLDTSVRASVPDRALQSLQLPLSRLSLNLEDPRIFPSFRETDYLSIPHIHCQISVSRIRKDRLFPGDLTVKEQQKKWGCVVMHDAPSFFVSPKNQFMYFKLRYFGDISDLCVPNIWIWRRQAHKAVQSAGQYILFPSLHTSFLYWRQWQRRKSPWRPCPSQNGGNACSSYCFSFVRTQLPVLYISVPCVSDLPRSRAALWLFAGISWACDSVQSSCSPLL